MSDQASLPYNQVLLNNQIRPADGSIQPVLVAGGGLAGCEAAWQLAARGIPVILVEMKPDQMTPAHHLPTLAELVCSNSLRAARLENAVGLLKEEMRRMGSLILACADATAIPAGGALAVDRDLFTAAVTDIIDHEPLIRRIHTRLDQIPAEGIVIIATGPLTDGILYDQIRHVLKVDTLHFFDAAAPIVDAASIDMSRAFRQSRYNRGGDDYINCPLNRVEFEQFWHELVHAELAHVHDFDKETVFEGCMPIETMAKRGIDTIRYGPMKPVGLVDPHTGKEPYACVQLRQDNRAASLYNLVGFQTRLTIKEQTRVFQMIPGLQAAEFVRFGVMHRNTFLPSPQVLESDYSASCRPSLYFAGQMTGVEGYVESASSGLLAGWQAALQVQGLDKATRQRRLPSARTVIGSLSQYIADRKVRHFQPMNANFGLVLPPEGRFKRKELRIQALIDQSLQEVEQMDQSQQDLAQVRLQLFHKTARIGAAQSSHNDL